MNADQRERMIAEVVKFLRPAIQEGEFSQLHMLEDESLLRSWGYIQAVIDTGVSRPDFDQMQMELANKATTCPIWGRAAVIAAARIVERGFAVHPDLAKILVQEAIEPAPSRRRGRPTGGLWFRDRRILEAVEIASLDLETGNRFTQKEAFAVVAESMIRLNERPTNSDEIARIFWRARKSRDAETEDPVYPDGWDNGLVG